MNEMSLEELLEKTTGLHCSIQDVFNLAMADSERNKKIFIDEFRVKLNSLENIHLGPFRTAILSEMNKLQLEVSPEVYRKIDMLLQVAFMAGQDTDAIFTANFIGAMRGQRTKHRIKSTLSGKTKKYNPVLVTAIKEIWRKHPNKTYGEMTNTLKRLASNGSLSIERYDIGFGKKGTIFDGEKLPSNSLTFSPIGDTITHHGRLKSISLNSLPNYYRNIKNNEW